MMWGFKGSWVGWFIALKLLFFWLVPLTIIVLLVYLAAIWGKEKKVSPDYTDKSDPLYILKQRYARGELTSEDYQKMKEELKQD